MMKDRELTDTELEFLEQSNFIESEYSTDALDQAIAAWLYLKNENKLTITNVLKTHALLLRTLNPRIAGKLRTVDVRVGPHICPSFDRVPKLLERWFDNYIYDVVYEEDGIKQTHIEFERIHPFEDGNGRIGRIILNWQRVKAGLPILVIHEGPEQFEYYKWFN